MSNLKTVLSVKTLFTINRAAQELCDASDRERNHLPTIDGLIACAGMVFYGHPVTPELRTRLLTALTRESFGAIAAELLGPP